MTYRPSRNDLIEGTVETIATKTGLILDLDFNSHYGGWLLAVANETDGSLSTSKFGSARRSTPEFEAFISGIMIGLEST